MFLSFSKQKYAIEHFNKANYVQKSNNIVKRKIEYLILYLIYPEVTKKRIFQRIPSYNRLLNYYKISGRFLYIPQNALSHISTE